MEENKFEAQKEYFKKYDVNWRFVRYYDKNEQLIKVEKFEVVRKLAE